MKVNIKVRYPNNLARAVETLEKSVLEARRALQIIESSVIVERIEMPNGIITEDGNANVDLGQ